MTFTRDNTTGYSDVELAALNTEWQEIVKREGLQPGTDDYVAREKQHADDVSRRVDD